MMLLVVMQAGMEGYGGREEEQEIVQPGRRMDQASQGQPDRLLGKLPLQSHGQPCTKWAYLRGFRRGLVLQRRPLI